MSETAEEKLTDNTSSQFNSESQDRNDTRVPPMGNKDVLKSSAINEVESVNCDEVAPSKQCDNPSRKKMIEENEIVKERQSIGSISSDKTDRKDKAMDNVQPQDQVSEQTSISRRKRTPFVHDPNKITIKFIFANRDGLHVTVDCKPADTVAELKGVLLSMWPNELPDCSNDGGERLRLICMGKGILSPDSRTLDQCSVPQFKTHATPVNVCIRPEDITPQDLSSSKKKKKKILSVDGNGNHNESGTSSRGCGLSMCIIM